MEVLTDATVVIILVCQMNIFYVLNLYSVICQLYFYKTGKIN